MSQDWLKVEKITPSKPEVRAIAAILGISRFDAFGRLFEVWSYFDGNSTDGCVRFADRTTVDDIAGVAGFAYAMVQVGWLLERNGRLTVPNFNRHNGESAKQRSLAALRQSRRRSSAGSPEKTCHATSVTSPLLEALPEESRREENTPLIPPEGGSGEFSKNRRRRRRRDEPRTESEIIQAIEERQGK